MSEPARRLLGCLRCGQALEPGLAVRVVSRDFAHYHAGCVLELLAPRLRPAPGCATIASVGNGNQALGTAATSAATFGLPQPVSAVVSALWREQYGSVADLERERWGTAEAALRERYGIAS